MEHPGGDRSGGHSDLIQLMRALVQRVTEAAVSVEGDPISSIGAGMLVLLGITHDDDREVAERLADKLLALRIFPDERGRMNEPLADREILCVSQFTLYGQTARGNRPSFTQAAGGEQARALYEYFCERCRAKQGVFGAHMQVSLVGDGPVTLLLEVSARASASPPR